MTEDFLAVVETKRFLGREFLTWLVHRLETAGGQIAEDGVVVQLALGDSVVLAGGAPDKARTTVVGAGDLGSEMGAGLRRGKLLDRAAPRRTDQRRYSRGVDPEFGVPVAVIRSTPLCAPWWRGKPHESMNETAPRMGHTSPVAT